MEDNVEYVKMSKYRRDVLKSLGKSSKFPSQISDDTGIVQNHISNVLKQLKDKGLVECINPEVRKGRTYRITDYGEGILEQL